MVQVTDADIMRIALEARCHADTVKRYIDGQASRPLTAAMIVAAAKKLKIKLPAAVKKIAEAR